MSVKNKRILFITWDGPQVNYLETLFFPIFKSLQDTYGYEFHIIQFLWDGTEFAQKRKQMFQGKGIHYNAISISKKYPTVSLLKSISIYGFLIIKYIKKNGIDAVMPRATTSLVIVNHWIKNLDVNLIYDADGFSQDERVDFSGLSPLSFRYRLYRDVELQGYHLAKAIICRSYKAKTIIENRAGAGFDSDKTFVVHNGTLVSSYLENRGHGQTCNMVYSGSIGPQYRVSEMLGIFKLIKNTIPYATMSFLTVQVDHLREMLQNDFPDLASEIVVKSVLANSVKAELFNYDIGISLREASVSMQGVAPIKVSEYAGAGLSIIYSQSIGDMEELMKDKPFGFCFRGYSEEENAKLINWVHDQIASDYSSDVFNFANETFSLSKTVEIYHHALQY